MNLKVVGLVALVGSAAMACGDSANDAPIGGGGNGGGNGGSSPSDGGGGSSAVLGGGGNPPVGGDATAGGAPPEAPDCYDSRDALFIDPTIIGGVTVDQDLCTAAQITDAYASCVGTTATQEDCDAYVAVGPASQACLDCLRGGGETPFPMPVTIVGDMFQYLSHYACAAEIAGLPQCEVPFQSLILCGIAACEGCEKDEKDACVNYAINDPEVCGAIEVSQSCLPLFSAPDFPAACVGDATSFEEGFTVLADLYCGAP
jgi:hypothetical protein